MSSDKGLPKPDIVIYIDLSIEEIKKRKGFGVEKYEIPEFQLKVGEVFNKLFDEEYWVRINGNQDIEEVKKLVIKCVEEVKIGRAHV